MREIAPCLWFDTEAEEAATFYTSVFPRSRIQEVTHYGPGGRREEGMVMTVEFELNGQKLIALNGGPEFTFSEAVSLHVSCETQEEVDAYWAALTEGGEEGPCGWLKDRFGLSWQVVPVGISRLLDGDDPARATRVMHAILGMNKIDIAALQVAAAGVAPARKATTTW
jgi:predicted 3-demethylubiquinone-9 3-methyltransferase (glyoxalase superfamily)